MKLADRILPAQRRVMLATRWYVVVLVAGMSVMTPAMAQQQDQTVQSSPSEIVANGFNGQVFSSVIATALTFLMPRTLEVHSAREFSLWGLNGLSAIDPALSVSVQRDQKTDLITLQMSRQNLIQLAAPPDSDVLGWAQVVTQIAQSAWQHSTLARTGGQDAVVQNFFDELFNHLDPYSRYVAPAPAVTDRAARTGGTANVGLTLAREGNDIVITGVNANGPAWAVGINTGERVISVNGRSVQGETAEHVDHLLTGDPDTRVSMVVGPRGRGARATVTLRRAMVPPETVFAYSSGNIVVMRITAFSTDTAQEMSQYLDQATQGTHLAGLIFDLRGNRGGVLQQAVTTAALVLDHGVAVTTRGRDPQANHVWAVQGGDMTDGTPIVVLVDGRTASAAEILAAALADHRRGVVVGSSTLGKGLVQMIGQMPNGGELFVTWSRDLAPLGWPLQGLGVIPQVCTSRGEADIAHQLQSLAAGTPDTLAEVTASRRVRYPVSVSRILEIRKGCPAAVGTDSDLDVARTLLDNPETYKAALSAIPDETSATATE